MVRCTFSPVRAWRLAVGPASTRTLGPTNCQPAMHPDFPDFVGKKLHCVGTNCKPWSTANTNHPGGTETTLGIHETEGRESVCTKADQAASRKVRWFEVGQFFEPRKARNASPKVAHQPLSPRSNENEVKCGGKSTFTSARRHRRVWPNPSFKPSPNGGPPGPVWRYAVHFRQSGPGVPPSVPA